MGLVCIIDGHHQEYLQRRWALPYVSIELTELKLSNNLLQAVIDLPTG